MQIAKDPKKQLSLGDLAAENPDDFQNFRAVCDQALQELDLPENFAVWQQNKAGEVLKFGSLPVLSVSVTRDGQKIQIRTGSILAEKAGLTLDLEDNSLKLGEIAATKLQEALKAFFDQVIDQRSTERFACCSLYRQCSIALNCVQPDRSLAINCAYRRNLKNGLVYYS